MAKWEKDTTQRNLGKQMHTCRVCGVKGSFITYLVREMFKGTRDEFTYFVCDKCNCLQISDIPNNLGDYYGGDYYSFQVGENPEMEYATPVNNMAKVLDVGCGAGDWLVQKAKEGWGNLYGCDPFLGKDRHYGKRVKIYNCSIHEMEGDGTFDLIRMSDSFEHVTDPLEVLKSARRLLKLGGMLYMTIPTYPNIAFERYGTHWYQLDAPRHIFLHSKQSLEWLSKASGLKISKIQYNSNDSQFMRSCCYKYGIPYNEQTQDVYRQHFSGEEMYRFTEESEKYNEQEYGDHMMVYWEKRDISKDRKVIFQRFTKTEKGHPYPYPPLYRQPDTDYICFTNDSRVMSKHWNIQLVEGLDDNYIEPYLAGYDVRWELEPSQIQMGAFPEALIDGDIINVPTLESLPLVKFDLEKFTPTADADGNYIYRKNPVYHDGKYDGRPLLLTIGVPVSNQIDTIDRCLSHIKPLLDNLDSELIVIDTGSTDGTIEVCKSYGARVIRYQWCDNMSAVRNEAVYNAKGEWYLSIDDDEWFEDVDDILTFFLSGVYKYFDCATYIQRNYKDMNGKNYNDFHTLRMMKITADVHFEGRIHDAIEFSKPVKLYALKSYAHHYGFVLDDAELRKKKFERNTPTLMYDVYEYPENPRYLFQLADGYKTMNKLETEIGLYLHAVAMALETENKDLGTKCISDIDASLLDANDVRLFKWSYFLEQLFPFDLVQQTAVSFCRETLAFKLKKPYKQVVEYYDSYVSFRNEYQRNRNNISVISSNVLALLEHRIYIMEADSVAFCSFAKLGMEMRAIEALKCISLEEMSGLLNIILLEGFTAGNEVYEALCGKITAMQWEEWGRCILNACAYNLSREDGYDMQAKRLPNVLAKISVDSILDWVKANKTENTLDGLIRYAMDFALRDGSLVNSSVQELCLCAWILKEAYVRKRKDDNAEEILYSYIAVMGTFAGKYYNSDYLIDISGNVVPPDIRAVYRMYVVIADGKATKENVAILKQALEIFPSFHEEIRIVLKNIKV